MLSYVLPVEEKVGLRGEDEERSPGSETRPLLGTGEGASLVALQHALTHAPPHEHATEKPPASPPDVDHHHHHHTTTAAAAAATFTTTDTPPHDASSNTTSSTATSPGLQPHHHPTPAGTTTVITTGSTTTTTTTTTAKPSLKRVSFGSSKGSMVETLIYDSPVGEEERIPEEEDAPTTPLAPQHFKDHVSHRFGTETGTQQKPASKVRVTFYESSKPLIVTSPEPSDLDQYSPQDLLMASPTTADQSMPAFDRQISSESGRDNPFRPDGDISKEADEIVEAIKSGRPLLAPPASPDAPDASSPQGTPATEPLLAPSEAMTPSEAPVSNQGEGRPGGVAGQGRGASLGSPGKAGANGSAPGDNSSTPGPVEVKHATVSPTEAADVERVVIKKKSKCGCCVIQ